MQVGEQRLRLRAADARADRVHVTLKLSVDGGDFHALNLVHGDGRGAVNQRVRRLDRLHLSRQEVERLGGTAKWKGGGIHDRLRVRPWCVDLVRSRHLSANSFTNLRSNQMHKACQTGRTGDILPPMAPVTSCAGKVREEYLRIGPQGAGRGYCRGGDGELSVPRVARRRRTRSPKTVDAPCQLRQLRPTKTAIT